MYEVPGDRLRELSEAQRERDRLRRALDLLDLSDDYTLDNAEPGEPVSCTRPVEVWREVRALMEDEPYSDATYDRADGHA